MQQDPEAHPQLLPLAGRRVVVVVALPVAAGGGTPALDQDAAVLLARDPVDTRDLAFGVLHVPLPGPEVELPKRPVRAGRRRGGQGLAGGEAGECNGGQCGAEHGDDLEARDGRHDETGGAAPRSGRPKLATDDATGAPPSVVR